jgi:hypothetical protein
MMSVMKTVVQEVKQRRRIKACGTISDVVLVVQILIEFGGTHCNVVLVKIVGVYVIFLF